MHDIEAICACLRPATATRHQCTRRAASPAAIRCAELDADPHLIPDLAAEVVGSAVSGGRCGANGSTAGPGRTAPRI
jgi:hypothetical protein